MKKIQRWETVQVSTVKGFFTIISAEKAIIQVNYPSQVLKHYLTSAIKLAFSGRYFSRIIRIHESWLRKNITMQGNLLMSNWSEGESICNASIDACIHNGIQYSNNVSLSYLLANAVHYIFYNTEIRLKVIMKNSSKHLDLTQF